MNKIVPDYYIIVSASNPTALARKVNEAAKKDYEPIGSIVCDSDAPANESLMQPMLYRGGK